MRKFHHALTFFPRIALFIIVCALLTSCYKDKANKSGNILFETGCYPYATFHNGKYYFMMQEDVDNQIAIWCADDIKDISQGERRVIWKPSGDDKSQHIWSPELHFINNKWYVYYEADNGNTDNHKIYVLENPSADPMKGSFTFKGSLTGNAKWEYGIHPTTFVNNGTQYLVWSGWPSKRIEIETQCIFIAKMSNPWTVSSDRVMLSRPIYEWERQWINPNGTRSAYPIFVNENPEAMISRDGKKVVVYYAASGCWTIYGCVGMVYADTNANLLDPKSWHKCKEPVFMSALKDSIYAPANICIVTPEDGADAVLLYETRVMRNDALVKQVRMKNIEFGSDNLPVFGKP